MVNFNCLNLSLKYVLGTILLFYELITYSFKSVESTNYTQQNNAFKFSLFYCLYLIDW